MQFELKDLMIEYHQALEKHEQAVEDFIAQPTASNNSRLRAAYQETIFLRQRLKQKLVVR